MEKSDLLSQLHIDRQANIEPPRPRTWLYVLAAIVVLGIAGIGWWWSRTARVIEVQVASARPAAQGSAQNSVLDASGYVTARRQATVSAKITGRVRDIRIEEGMRVEEGQILATLDDVEAEAQLALSRAQHESARSQWAEVQAALGQAEREQQRQQTLQARKLTSAQAVDRADTEVTTLRARLNSIKRQIDVAERGLRIAQINLDNTIVRSPFAGVVTVKAAQPGEIISPFSAGGAFTRSGIGTIVDMESLEIEVDVNESYIQRVQPGQPVEAVLNAYADWKIPARVIAIIPTADRAKATVKVRIAMEQKDARIVPDMGVRVAFLEERTAATKTPSLQGVLVPANAIQSEDKQTVVWVLQLGKIQRRLVEVGVQLGDNKQILSGLMVGDQVVIGSSAKLEEGRAAIVAQKP